MKPHNEIVFENDIIKDLIDESYLEGDPKNYNADLALYPEDLITYLRATQPEMVEKVCKKQGSDEKGEKHIAREVAKAIDKNGALNSIRREVEFVGAKFKLLQFKPDNQENDVLIHKYNANILRVVRQIVYSPFAKEQREKTGKGSGIIDLVLFVNGLPLTTLELKTDFTQNVQDAVYQYKKDRKPFNQSVKKSEPLLAFNRRALVHFAVSTDEVYMTTRLNGENTFFLPFNKGSGDGGGNPPNPKGYATDYLWKQVFTKDTWLKILGRFIHLQDKDKDGNPLKESEHILIFPRYHQLDVVTKLINTASDEGAGQNYLIQHSAGSGKSNSIAWVAHQLAALNIKSGAKQGDRLFRSVIVITDRNVLDSQLQDTIYQFDHQDGVVERINRDEGTGSKSEKLKDALLGKSPIIIVTIQTFPFVLETIQENTSLKDFNFAVIADEAHSSQTGKTANKLKEVLQADLQTGEEISAEDILTMSVEGKRKPKNISYFAFTATPKPKTLEMFGRLRDPNKPKSKDNTPVPFHVYTMRQAIEEGFIFDVLKNYVTYDVAYKLANYTEDKEVDSQKAKSKISKWVRLHPHNISQKIEIIIEHFNSNIKHLLDYNAKAMVVTGSRKEAVRFKLAFDEYIKKNKLENIHAIVAFSGEVIDKQKGSEPFTERNMNPTLNGKDIRKAFDTKDYQILLVANKFQTGFDQPKLCAMYVDKKLSGVDCVQTLSRLNRIYKGKDRTFILDFVNEADAVKEAFEPFYKATLLSDNSDPDLIFTMKNDLIDARIFTWTHVEELVAEYLKQEANIRNKKQDKAVQSKLSAICKVPADNFKNQYKDAVQKHQRAKEDVRQAEQSKDNNMLEEAKAQLEIAKDAKAVLEAFKSKVNNFIEFYEFMSNVIDYDSVDLEKLYQFLVNLKQLIKYETIDEQLTIAGIRLSHFKIHNKREHQISLQERELDPDVPSEAGAFDHKKKLLSEIIESLNELFDEEISEEDAINKLMSFGKSLEPEVLKNDDVVHQMKAGNTLDQIMLGDYPKVLSSAILETANTNNGLSTQLLTDDTLMTKFAKSMLSVFLENMTQGTTG